MGPIRRPDEADDEGAVMKSSRVNRVGRADRVNRVDGADRAAVKGGAAPAGSDRSAPHPAEALPSLAVSVTRLGRSVASRSRPASAASGPRAARLFGQPLSPPVLGETGGETISRAAAGGLSTASRMTDRPVDPAAARRGAAYPRADSAAPDPRAARAVLRPAGSRRPKPAARGPAGKGPAAGSETTSAAADVPPLGPMAAAMGPPVAAYAAGVTVARTADSTADVAADAAADVSAGTSYGMDDGADTGREGGAVPAPSGAADPSAEWAPLPLDQLLEALEERLLRELERRGGRFSGVF